MASTNRRIAGDPLSMSLTDVLCCMLGASALLFLIFIGLIRFTFESGVGNTRAASEASKTVQRSIQSKINKGFATASIRLVMNNKAVLEQFELRHVSGGHGDMRNNLTALSFENAGMYGHEWYSSRGFDGAYTLSATGSFPLAAGDNFYLFANVYVGGFHSCVKTLVSTLNWGSIEIDINESLPGFIRISGGHSPC